MSRGQGAGPGLTRALVAAVAAALTALWLSGWVQWARGLAGGPAAGPAVAWALAAAELAAMALAGRLLAPRPAAAGEALLYTPRPVARWAVAAAGLAAVVAIGWLALPCWPCVPPLGFGRAVLIVGPSLFAAAYAWWLGLRLAGAPLEHHQVVAALYASLGGLAGLTIANIYWQGLEQAALLGRLLALLAVGLAGLALANWRRLNRQQPLAAPAGASLRRQWLAMSGVFIVGVISLGLAAARLLAPAALARLGALADRALTTVMMGLGLALFPIVSLFNWLLGPLAPLLRDLMRTLRLLVGQIIAIGRGLFAWLLRLMTMPLPRLFIFEPGELEALLASPEFQAAGRWGFVGLTLLVAAMVFALALRRRLPASSADADLVRESILSGQLVWRQLRGLVRSGPPAAGPPPAYVSLSGDGDDPRLIVRRAYQAMLDWAQAGSHPRLAGQTPAAYGERLAHTWPQARAAILALTGAYERARYAPESPSLAEARSVEGALAELRNLTRSL